MYMPLYGYWLLIWPIDGLPIACKGENIKDKDNFLLGFRKKIVWFSTKFYENFLILQGEKNSVKILDFLSLFREYIYSVLGSLVYSKNIYSV